MVVKDLTEKLQAPFHPDDIEWRVGATNSDKSKGLALAYVTNRAIQNRLDELFGPFGWKNEFREWKDKSQLCGISIKHGDEWITKWDGADDSNMEATKGGLSDAMKRAAYQWGIGRYLYKLPSVWVPIKQVGRSYVIVQNPELPKWALPEVHKTSKTPTKQTQEISKENETEHGGENNKCSACGTEINQAVQTFSIKRFGKPLCRECQAKAKKGA